MNSIYGFSRLVPNVVREAPLLAIATTVTAIALALFFIIKRLAELWNPVDVSVGTEGVGGEVQGVTFVAVSEPVAIPVGSEERVEESPPYEQPVAEKLGDESIQSEPVVFLSESKGDDEAGSISDEAKSDNKEKPISYEALDVRENEKQDIFSLITTLGAEKVSMTHLWSLEDQLKALGQQVDHVHPFKFLAVIILNDTLRKCFSKVMETTIIRRNFMSDFGKRLDREKKVGTLISYCADFLKELGISLHHLEKIKKFCDAQKWTDLINQLLKLKN